MNFSIIKLMYGVGVLLISAILFLLFILFGVNNKKVLENRLKALTDEEESYITPENIIQNLPPLVRIFYPIIEPLSNYIIQFTPKIYTEKIKKRLLRAGLSEKLNYRVFITIQLMTILLLGGGGLLLFITKNSGLLFLIVMVNIGIFLPNFVISTKISKRQKEFRKKFPFALELLNISVKAGLGFDTSIKTVVDESGGIVSQEFSRVQKNMAIGVTRNDALAEMSDAIGLPEVEEFVSSVRQAEKMGVGMTELLGRQSEYLRNLAKERARTQAYKAPVKMTIPLVLFIFPAIIILLIGPAIINILQSGLF